MITVALINRSQQPLPWTLERLAEAGQEYASQVSLKWNLPAVRVVAGDQAAAGSWPLFLADHTDQQGTLAYHSYDGQGPWGISFLADTVADGLPAEAGVFHELAELLVNPHCQLVLPYPGQPGQYLFGEPVDPVQQCLRQSASGLQLPDFVYPSWFGLANHSDLERDSFDWFGLLHAPAELAWGGYCSCWSQAGGWSMRSAGMMAGLTCQRKLEDPLSRLGRHRGRVSGYESGRD